MEWNSRCLMIQVYSSGKTLWTVLAFMLCSSSIVFRMLVLVLSFVLCHSWWPYSFLNRTLALPKGTISKTFPTWNSSKNVCQMLFMFLVLLVVWCRGFSFLLGLKPRYGSYGHMQKSPEGLRLILTKSGGSGSRIEWGSRWWFQIFLYIYCWSTYPPQE